MLIPMLFSWLVVPCTILGLIALFAIYGKEVGKSCTVKVVTWGALLCVGYVFFVWMTDHNVYREIHDTELIGLWVLTNDSKNHLISDGYKDEGLRCVIDFRADKTATFSSVNYNRSPLQHQTIEGFWKLERADSDELFRVTISEQDNHHDILSLGFFKHAGELRISEFYGDPDSCEFIEYSKSR